MNWTTEWPKEPGWYWMDDTLFSDRAPEIVRFDGDHAFDTYQGLVRPSPSDMKPFLFYGPIEPPASKSPKNA